MEALLKNKEDKVLRLLLNIREQVQIKAKGVSMYPEIVNNADIVIEKSAQYSVGDILVYNYKDEGLLVHRLLATNPTYICKGDNAFRIESILPGDVIGKVISVEGRPVKKWCDWEIELSFKIGNLYLELQNGEKVIASSIFKLYATTILNKKKDYNIHCTDVFDNISFDLSTMTCTCFCKSTQIMQYHGVEGAIVYFAWKSKKIGHFLATLDNYINTTPNVRGREAIPALINLLETDIVSIE